MPVGHMNELREPEEDLRSPGQAQGLVKVLLLGAEAEEAPMSSASFPRVSFSSAAAHAECLLKQAQDAMIAELLEFLLVKYRAKEPASQTEMLNVVLRDNQGHFPVVFHQAVRCLQLVFGVEMKEVDPREPTYILVPTLGLTLNDTLRDAQSMPKAGLLVMVLSVIVLLGDRAYEEEIWESISMMGVFPGVEHPVFGEPRELLAQVWVREGYLECRQVPDGDPTCCEFLWGPRAYAETSKGQVIDYLHRANGIDSRFFPRLRGRRKRSAEAEQQPGPTQAHVQQV